MSTGVFKTWLLDKYLEEDGPIGDLARDVDGDRGFPTTVASFAGYPAYIEHCHGCDGAVEAMREAVYDYMNTEWVAE